jgi:hypothetical protein
MSRKVFSTFFSLILLIVIAVPGLNAWPRVFLRISSRFPNRTGYDAKTLKTSNPSSVV